MDLDIQISKRITSLKRKMLSEPRYLSIHQARIITKVYRDYPDEPRVIQRALALSAALKEMPIRIDPEELIVGNRTPGVRSGVVFPEAGISWLEGEIETLPTREQDRFNVNEEDIRIFREEIVPFWKGNTLEDAIETELGTEIAAVKKVVKINQTDHAQGHICPDTAGWLRLGPAGLLKEAKDKLGAMGAEDPRRDFYDAVIISLEGAVTFIRRYGDLAAEMAGETAGEGTEERENMLRVGGICLALADRPPESYREALQSLWFLFVILQMESNASSFSPGRMDQFLYPYLQADLDAGRLRLESALELTEALWLKFNQIVYLRSSASARYFAGFPIGFNVAVGGQIGADAEDGANIVSYLCLKAQEHLGLPQPNLSARLFEGSDPGFIRECARVIGLGSGMPQIFNDEIIIPALKRQGITHDDAVNYAIVGCVELSTHGNNLGWSDAAMFNLVKVLELAANDGTCLLTGEQIGPKTGALPEFQSYADFEDALRKQIDHFMERMFPLCERVEKFHAELLPSPFLSSVIQNCLEAGIDVTAGGAKYNLSGIQAIQAANIADSLAVLRESVFTDKNGNGAFRAGKEELLEALRSNFEDKEILRQRLINKVPKFGNDVEWVDRIANEWFEYFADRLEERKNARGGPYHTGLYTVSAHVPMGKNVGATPDGRLAGAPLADGGTSPMYGRDLQGPTAVLKSVSRLNFLKASNGSLLNMKFLPAMFDSEEDRNKFAEFLKAFIGLNISHVQFNVVSGEDLRKAQERPEEYSTLTVRVAGYTAYFTDLAADLQNEIIARTNQELQA